MPDPITYEIKIDPTRITEVLLRIIPVPILPPSPHFKGEPGIDVSKWQGVIDWDKVVATNQVSFAGIRATMGTRGLASDGSLLGVDSQFKRNWTEAKRVGIQRLPYHYFSNNRSDGLKQLENFLDYVGDDLGELPPVLDVEPIAGQTIVNRQANENEVLAWLTECQARTGKRPAIYTAAWAWPLCTTVPAWSTEYPLWVASYTAATTPRLPAPWKKYMAWQYSRTGKLNGIVKPDGTSADVDLNRWGEL